MKDNITITGEIDSAFTQNIADAPYWNHDETETSDETADEDDSEEDEDEDEDAETETSDETETGTSSETDSDSPAQDQGLPDSFAEFWEESEASEGDIESVLLSSISMTDLTPTQRQIIAVHVADPELTQREIAAETKTGRSTVGQTLREKTTYDSPNARPEKPPETFAALNETQQAAIDTAIRTPERSKQQIGRELGMSTSYVSETLRRYPEIVDQRRQTFQESDSDVTPEPELDPEIDIDIDLETTSKNKSDPTGESLSPGETISGTTADDLGEERTTLLPASVDAADLTATQRRIIDAWILNRSASSSTIAERADTGRSYVVEVLDEFVGHSFQQTPSSKLEPEPESDSTSDSGPKSPWESLYEELPPTKKRIVDELVADPDRSNAEVAAAADCSAGYISMVRSDENELIKRRRYAVTATDAADSAVATAPQRETSSSAAAESDQDPDADASSEQPAPTAIDSDQPHTQPAQTTLVDREWERDREFETAARAIKATAQHTETGQAIDHLLNIWWKHEQQQEQAHNQEPAQKHAQNQTREQTQEADR